mmetsp:Transcript_92302/g.246863  ORF Transcript_92302/g.246863 Transcript_92302/m.246863 type:complete len:346 (-) Transcript_92302:16-1053(-)
MGAGFSDFCVSRESSAWEARYSEHQASIREVRRLLRESAELEKFCRGNYDSFSKDISHNIPLFEVERMSQRYLHDNEINDPTVTRRVQETLRKHKPGASSWSYDTFKEYITKFLAILEPALQQKLEFYSKAMGKPAPINLRLQVEPTADGNMGTLRKHVPPLTPAVAAATESTAPPSERSTARLGSSRLVIAPYGDGRRAGTAQVLRHSGSGPLTPVTPHTARTTALRERLTSKEGLLAQVYRLAADSVHYVVEWKILCLSVESQQLRMLDPYGGPPVALDLRGLRGVEHAVESRLLLTVQPAPPERRAMALRFESGSLCVQLQSEVDCSQLVTVMQSFVSQPSA